MNTTHTRRVPALIVTCAFAMLAFAAIPTDAKASSYYNGVDISMCAGVHYTLCGDMYYYNDDDFGFGMYYGGGIGYNYTQPVTYSYPQYYSTYSKPTYYSYPVVTQRPRRRETGSDYFFRDYWQAQTDWDAQYRRYQALPL